MSVPNDAEQDLCGVPMDDETVNEFLREHGEGILSLADSNDAYAVPVSFGYAYKFDSETRWRSVLVTAQLERVPEENQNKVDEILFENAQFVSLFPHQEPVMDQPRY